MSMFKQDEELRYNLGDTIRRARKRAGLTRHSLSIITGIDQSTLSNWENGKNWPYTSMIEEFIERLPGTFPKGDIQRIKEAFHTARWIPSEDEAKVICQKYCRFTERTDIPDDVLKLICAGCPVDRLFGE